MANRKQRRMAKAPGMTYAQQLSMQKYQRAAVEAAVYNEGCQIQSEIRTQRALWMAAIAMHNAFGIGKDRFQKWAAELDKVLAWYTEMLENVDDVYANEKLRRAAQQITGIEIKPLWDEEMTDMIKAREAVLRERDGK